MEQFEGRVAVVTGAASGIGRALTGRFASQGMRVVLADVEQEALDAAAQELSAAGHEVLAVRTDTSDRTSVEALADAAYERFGAVNVLCNNAGVAGGGGLLWETTAADWDWVLGVNLMGVVHGVQAFLPRMIAGGEEGHVVNTSSVLGLSTGGGSIYDVSKHGVTRLTEGLYYDLQSIDSPIGVSVLCPGMIATNIISAGRNRPKELQNNVSAERQAEIDQGRRAAQAMFLEEGMPPSEVAEIVDEAIRTDRFYILTHPDGIKARVERRFLPILQDLPPNPPAPEGFPDLRGSPSRS